jgi:hypothetical protein
MSDAFTPQVRALLDRLEPPALSADFADRVLAQAVAKPPLPLLRKRRLHRRFALAAAVAGLVGVAAAAVVPADAWRKIPVVGEIVELIAPQRTVPASAPVRSEPAPAAPAVPEPMTPRATVEAEPATRPVPEAAEALSPVEDRAVMPPPAAEPVRPAERSEPILRASEPMPPTMREIPVAERPAAEMREAASAVVDTRPELAPERIKPADTSETRQQIRERTTTRRQSTRERAERRERRISRAN